MLSIFVIPATLHMNSVYINGEEQHPWLSPHANCKWWRAGQGLETRQVLVVCIGLI